MKLYNVSISPNCKRARIVAAELDIALDHVPLDFTQGDNRTADYLSLNPLGKIPTLTDDSFALWESGAVIWYLASQRPSALIPQEPRAQADLLRWMFFGSCHLDPNYTILVVERFLKARRALPPDGHLTEHAERELARFIPVVEQQLSRRDYVTGSFGLGDVVLGCTLELSPLVRFDWSPYPNVRAWIERLQARPSWRSAAAS